jgi:type VI secretion system secreted protein VgrG
MRLTTPLGGDVLVIEGMNGTETVSRPFELTFDLLSENAEIDGVKLLRKPMAVTIELESGAQRCFHGLVRRFVQLNRSVENLTLYRAEIVPWFWFLSTASNCRIFQHKSVPDIVKMIFGEHGMTDYRVALSASYSPREYCVQYRETDFDFVSRLLEEEGIFYFFEHAAGKHTMVLADSPSAIKNGPVPKMSAESATSGTLKGNYIIDFETGAGFFSNSVSLTDYNMETPFTSLAQKTVTTVQGIDNSGFGLYDYPGKYGTRGDGDRLVRIRMEEREATNVTVAGIAKGAPIACGTKVEVVDFYRHDANKPYFVLSVKHHGTNGSFRSETAGEAYEFIQTFTGMPATVPYRPPRITPKAVVRGAQTAVVVGPAGEEIYVDKYGRVKVQFFWDREGQKDDKSSCYIRVSSAWAGKQWGFIQLPRIGQEVVVDFLEGDPDRPIIVGRVYNADQMPPYELPGNKTQSGGKSRSSKGASAANYNELRFEDNMGSEMLTLHAEKDSTIEVEHDETHWVGNDRTKTIDHDETVRVKHDRTETVDNNETITIHGTRTETVDKDETIIIHGGRVETVDKDEVITIKGALSTGIQQSEVHNVDQDQKIDVKGALNLKTGATRTVEIGTSDALNVKQGVTVSAGTTIAIEAKSSIEIKVGPNSIKIDPSGITIKGMKVAIQGDIAAEMKSAMTTVKSDAVLTLQGTLTKIN